MTMRLKVFLMTTVLIAAAVAVHKPAEACMHGVEFDVNETQKLLVRAERNLLKGKPHWAFSKAMEALLDLEDADLITKGSYQEKLAARYLQRARRIAALATVRRDGHVSRRFRVSLKQAKPAQRLANLKWALAELDRQSEARPKDLALRAYRAEALAKFDAHRDEAVRILSNLASRDLLPDPHTAKVFIQLKVKLPPSV